MCVDAEIATDFLKLSSFSEYACFSNLLDVLNPGNSLNSIKVLWHLRKYSIAHVSKVDRPVL